MHVGVGVSAAVIDAPQVKREKQTRDNGQRRQVTVVTSTDGVTKTPMTDTVLQYLFSNF